MTHAGWLLVVCAGVSVTADGVAQETGTGGPSRGAPTADAEYAFDDDLVHGDHLSPNLELLHARRRGARDSLIRVREHFVDRLLQSVEQL